jgi:hypothetical protein
MSRRLRSTAILGTLVIAACRPDEPTDAALRGEVERLLAAYGAALVEAYTKGDAEALAGVATERERFRIAQQIASFEAQGTGLRPVLKSLAVESIERAGRTSLTAVTDELWDLRTVALGTELPMGEELDQQNRIEYTLLRDQGRWLVLSRNLRTSSADAAL